MTHKDHLQLELMLYAINHDFFGYGSSVTKRKDGKYISIVDGERSLYTGTELAKEWEYVSSDDKKEIIKSYFKLYD